MTRLLENKLHYWGRRYISRLRLFFLLSRRKFTGFLCDGNIKLTGLMMAASAYVPNNPRRMTRFAFNTYVYIKMSCETIRPFMAHTSYQFSDRLDITVWRLNSYPWIFILISVTYTYLLKKIINQRHRLQVPVLILDERRLKSLLEYSEGLLIRLGYLWLNVRVCQFSWSKIIKNWADTFPTSNVERCRRQNLISLIQNHFQNLSWYLW